MAVSPRRAGKGSGERINFLVPLMKLVSQFRAKSGTYKDTNRPAGHATDYGTNTDTNTFFPGWAVVGKCRCRRKTQCEPKQQRYCNSLDHCHLLRNITAVPAKFGIDYTTTTGR